MKQSKKLLSIFLAMLMLLGTVSVIGNAALVKTEVKYDSIDNAKLTPEQVAEIILDMVDNDLLAGMDDVDLAGIIKLRLSGGVNAIFQDIVDLRQGAVWTLASGIIGDAKNLDFDALVQSGKFGLFQDPKPYQRSHGNLKMVYQLLQFIGDNASLLSKIGGGLGTSDGLSLGTILNGVLDLGEIQAILNDLPGFLTRMVYDMLIYGSFGYDKDAEGLNNNLPAEVNTLDKMVNVAIKNLLTKPQKYSWVPTGEYTTDEEGNQVPITKKDWDMESYILDASKLENKNLDLSKNSFFTLLDTVLPVAYETFGTVVLNHDVKKIFMEAMGVDFVRITDKKEIADITKAGTGYINVNGEGSESTSATDIAKVKNYFCNAQMWQVDGTWYFRDYVTTEIGTDAEGNPITEKQDRFFKAQTYSVDELYSIFNWDYELTASDLDFATMTSANGYGSLVGSLNHILYVILKKAINPTAIGLTAIDDLWVDGGNDNFNENLMRTAKFLLKNYTFMFFGRNEAYVDLNTLEATDAFKQKVDSFGNDAAGREGLIAYMLLPMLGDVLPQLVYTPDMFEDGLQIEQLAALLVREFITDLTPQISVDVNSVFDYDSQIFVDPTLKTGRSLITGKNSDYWMNLVLNMGLDLAAIYLDNIANFGVDLDALKDLHSIANGTTIQPWQVVLQEIVDWAVLYVGSGSNSVINGLDPTSLGVARCITYNYTDDSYTFDKSKFVEGNGKGSAFFTLSTALNTLLPLGIINGGSSPEGSANNFGLDVEVIFNKLKDDIIPTLDIEGIIGLFGRNNHETNFLGQTNLYKEILDLVNQLLKAILGNNILQVGTTPSTILADAISKDSLKKTINALLSGLNNRKVGLLEGALPIVALFISDWGGEQEIASPELSIYDVTYANNGSLNYNVTVRNGSKGVWRSYMEGKTRKQDLQYSYEITSISTLQSGVVEIGSGWNGKLDYGATKNFTITGTVGPEGAADRIDIAYKVSDEDGNWMGDGKTFVKSYFTYYAYSGDTRYRYSSDDYDYEFDKAIVFADTDDMSSVNEKVVGYFYNGNNGGKNCTVAPVSQPGNGFTLNKWYEGDADKKTGYDVKGAVTFTPEQYTPVGENSAVYPFKYSMSSKKSGSGGTVSTGEWTSYVIIYSAEQMGLLEDLVDKETGLNRRPESYSDQGAYTDYLIALANAISLAWNPRIDGSFVATNIKPARENLEKTIKTLEASEVQGGGDTIATAVDNLKAQLNDIQDGQDGLNGKDYRTYMLYRWEKYKSARSDANWIIDLQEEVKFGAPTKHFPYGGYSEAKYTNLVTGDKYEAFLKGLLVDMTEEEKAQAQENYKNRSNEYYGQTTLDVAQYSNLLTRTRERLILRTTKPVTSYLQKEINSAEKDIGTTQGNYSTKSWAPYIDAYNNAKAALSSDSQDVIFAAKYQLQVTRNNLRTTDKEADYSELETLITQADNALKTQAANKNTYANADEDFGKLLVALGYTTEGGTKLFGGARDVFNTSYDKHDQDEVDDAADELKAALAKLEFKNFATTKPDTVGTTAVETGETDENGDAVTENIYTTKIAAKQLKDAVASAIKGGNSSWNVQVSLDEKYTAEDAGLALPVGTGATVTIIKNEGGVNVPVATIKVIVEGDVTGDGVIDGLDCMVVDLVANNNTSLGGVYLEAGDLASNAAEQRITLADLNEVALRAIA